MLGTSMQNNKVGTESYVGHLDAEQQRGNGELCWAPRCRTTKWVRRVTLGTTAFQHHRYKKSRSQYNYTGHALAGGTLRAIIEWMAGKAMPSPTPSSTRAARRGAVPSAAASGVSAVKSDHSNTPAASTRLPPYLSAS
eukprot:1160649-Pelagomonas_calceolata.AAC.8